MPDEISDEEALRRLREFLRDLQRLLAQIEERPRRVLPGRHHAGLSTAWQSLQPKFDSAFAALTASSTTGVLPTLRLRGLTGDELVFKLGLFAHARDRYLDHGGPRKGKARGRRWWARWRRRLHPTLQAADVILTGLGSVFPGVEAVREHMAALAVGIGLADRQGE